MGSVLVWTSLCQSDDCASVHAIIIIINGVDQLAADFNIQHKSQDIPQIKYIYMDITLTALHSAYNQLAGLLWAFISLYLSRYISRVYISAMQLPTQRISFLVIASVLLLNVAKIITLYHQPRCGPAVSMATKNACYHSNWCCHAYGCHVLQCKAASLGALPYKM